MARKNYSVYERVAPHGTLAERSATCLPPTLTLPLEGGGLGGGGLLGDRTPQPQAAGPALSIERQSGEREGVHARAVEPGRPVEMRAGGASRLADRADHIATVHAHAVFDCRCVQVEVHGEQP